MLEINSPCGFDPLRTTTDNCILAVYPLRIGYYNFTTLQSTVRRTVLRRSILFDETYMLCDIVGLKVNMLCDLVELKATDMLCDLVGLKSPNMLCDLVG